MSEPAVEVTDDGIDKIDPHHHIWDLQRNYHPWLIDPNPPRRVYGDSTPLRHDYLIADYLADAANQRIVKSVYLQCGYDPRDPVGETRYVQEVSDRHPKGFPHAVVAHADLDADDVETVLKGHCEFPLMRGIRMLLNWHETPHFRWSARPDYMTDPKWLRGYELLGKHGLSFDCQLYPHQMLEAEKVAARFPEVPMIVNHTGMPVDRDAAGVERWREGMAALASHAHVSVKISGLGMVDHQWTEESIRPFVLDTISIFGAGRTMFASNFPVDKLKGSFDRHYEAFKSIVRDLPLAERRKLFHDTAQRVYRL